MNTLTDDDFRELAQRVLELKVLELFQEPCQLYEDEELQDD
jgi:hypothetical protein